MHSMFAVVQPALQISSSPKPSGLLKLFVKWIVSGKPKHTSSGQPLSEHKLGQGRLWQVQKQGSLGIPSGRRNTGSVSSLYRISRSQGHK